MIRWLALFGISFGVLTRLDGSPVYIVPDMVTEVTAPFGGMCNPKDPLAKALVRTLASLYCVRETPDEARRILSDTPTAKDGAK